MTTSQRKKADDAKPWNKDNPKEGEEKKHLTPAQKASAKRHAKEAGRPYPNLVDNMRAAASSSKQ
ncbi:MAG: hypothetical protein EOO27_41520 [Comamonadaceae bacterium]|nr:MAG: hypothetical protein EOO27_41520 [Comamonadaceae bacterium]